MRTPLDRCLALTPPAVLLSVAATVLTLGACGGDEPAAGTPAEAADQAVLAVVHDWYASANPAACDQMTDRMLQFGWESSGDAGRQACGAAVAAAEPVEAVEVSPLSRQGASADLRVSYSVNGEAREDVVSLVSSGSGWLIDGVERVTATSP